MKSLLLKIVGALSVFVFSAGVNHAATIGVAVHADPPHNPVAQALTIGATDPDRASLAAFAGVTTDDVIGYYIPLKKKKFGSTCDFGDCGIYSDRGRGGVLMSMWIEFAGVEGGDSTLNLYFEDLDLPGANDPWYFFEYLTVYDTNENHIVSFDSISDPLISGDADTQQSASLDLGTLIANQDYLIKLDFLAKSKWKAKNTPEYLVAEISAVPVPAAGLLMLGGIGALIGLGRRPKTHE